MLTQKKDITFIDIFVFIKKYIVVFAACFVFGLLLAFAYVANEKTFFQSTIKLEATSNIGGTLSDRTQIDTSFVAAISKGTYTKIYSETFFADLENIDKNANLNESKAKALKAFQKKFGEEKATRNLNFALYLQSLVFPERPKIAGNTFFYTINYDRIAPFWNVSMSLECLGCAPAVASASEKAITKMIEKYNNDQFAFKREEKAQQVELATENLNKNRETYLEKVPELELQKRKLKTKHFRLEQKIASLERKAKINTGTLGSDQIGGFDSFNKSTNSIYIIDRQNGMPGAGSTYTNSGISQMLSGLDLNAINSRIVRLLEKSGIDTKTAEEILTEAETIDSSWNELTSKLHTPQSLLSASKDALSAVLFQANSPILPTDYALPGAEINLDLIIQSQNQGRFDNRQQRRSTVVIFGAVFGLLLGVFLSILDYNKILKLPGLKNAR